MFKKVEGVDGDFVFAQRSDNVQAIVNTFLPGQKVTLRVTAVNNAGESSASDDVTVVVG